MRYLSATAEGFGTSKDRDKLIIESSRGITTRAALVVNASLARVIAAVEDAQRANPPLPLVLQLNLTDGVALSHANEITTLLGSRASTNNPNSFLGTPRFLQALESGDICPKEVRAVKSVFHIQACVAMLYPPHSMSARCAKK